LSIITLSQLSIKPNCLSATPGPSPELCQTDKRTNGQTDGQTHTHDTHPCHTHSISPTAAE